MREMRSIDYAVQRPDVSHIAEIAKGIHLGPPMLTGVHRKIEHRTSPGRSVTYVSPAV